MGSIFGEHEDIWSVAADRQLIFTLHHMVRFGLIIILALEQHLCFEVCLFFSSICLRFTLFGIVLKCIFTNYIPSSFFCNNAPHKHQNKCWSCMFTSQPGLTKWCMNNKPVSEDILFLSECMFGLNAAHTGLLSYILTLACDRENNIRKGMVTSH